MDELTADIEFRVEEKHHPKIASKMVRYLQPETAPLSMSDDEKEVYYAVHDIPTDQFGVAQNVPDDAEVGDVVTASEVFESWDGEGTESDDVEETAETDPVENAREEAAETGNRVHIDTHTVPCDGSEGDECSTDRVARYATPDGGIETERTHLH